MFRLILQTQGRLEGFSVLSHLLSPKVKSTLLSTNDLKCALADTSASYYHGAENCGEDFDLDVDFSYILKTAAWSGRESV